MLDCMIWMKRNCKELRAKFWAKCTVGWTITLCSKTAQEIATKARHAERAIIWKQDSPHGIKFMSQRGAALTHVASVEPGKRSMVD